MSDSYRHHSGCCACSHDDNLDHDNHNHNHQGDRPFNLHQEILPLLGITILFLCGLIFQEQLDNTPGKIGKYLVFIPLYLYSGWGVLSNAGRNLIKGRLFDEQFLMSVATLAAIAIQELPEAVGVMLFYQIGELFQEFSVNRSRQSIKAILAVRPDYANVKTLNGDIQRVSPELVDVGSLIIVKPGDKIPLDGQLINGNARVDTSALTGESMPIDVQPGDRLLAGMVNQTGVLTIEVTKPFGESSIAKILELVENARSQKSQTERFMTTFARYYTPVVVFISLVIALFPPLLIPGQTHMEWVYRALIVLVVSCPCGLVISIPLGYFGGIGGAAKQGILVKGSTFLDDLIAVKTVVFDKTGTLTEGIFEVAEIWPDKGFDSGKLMEIAAQVESFSNHPVAQAICQAYGQKVETSNLVDYEEIAGCGIKARIGNKMAIAGSDRLLHLEEIEHTCCHLEETAVHVAIDRQYAGHILIRDRLKNDAIHAIQSLKKLGVERTVMLTGDNQTVAQKVAQEVGLDAYEAELLPEDKVKAMERLLKENRGKLVFVGDGINDAPVIARADVGIAMGGMGADAAIETADIVIMTDAPSKVAEAMAIAQKTRRIVWQNIGFSLGIKGIFIILGAMGMATIWEAVFADVGVALIAIVNASRALRGVE